MGDRVTVIECPKELRGALVQPTRIAVAGDLSRDFDCLGYQLEPPGLRTGSSRALVQDRRRPDDRVSGEGQFIEQVEDSGLDSVGTRCGLKKNRFEVPQLLSDSQHLFCTEVSGIGEHRQAVAPEGISGEHVDVAVGEAHHILSSQLGGEIVGEPA